MRYWSYKRCYPIGLVEKEMRKGKFSWCTSRNKREKKGVYFVITFHPNLKNIINIINQNFYVLNMNEDVKSVFTQVPIIYILSARKLSIYLIKPKLYP